MTVSTPQPIDKPDWTSAVPFAGDLLQSELVLLDGVISGGSFVGENSGYTFLCTIGTAGSGWRLILLEGSERDGGSYFTTMETYEGFGECVILDTLPVASPWVSFLVEDDGGGNGTLTLVTSLQTVRGANRHVNGSSCMHEETAAAPKMSTTSIYGGFLSPGLYNYYMYTAAGLAAGQLQFVGLDHLGNPYPFVRQTNPPAFFEAYGQLIVGNFQPVFQVVNVTASDVTFNCDLTGPL
jgi:hypothetical protein